MRDRIMRDRAQLHVGAVYLCGKKDPDFNDCGCSCAGVAVAVEATSSSWASGEGGEGGGADGAG
jgi:hypothetical protein